MNRRESKGRPTFFWQGMLISLPVILLAGFGIWALQQDRLSVEKQARDRAAAIAPDILPPFEQFLHAVDLLPGKVAIHAGLYPAVAFEVSASNTLLTPMPLVWPPAPPEPRIWTDPDRVLKKGKLEQWKAAEAASDRCDWAKAAELYLVFLNNRQRIDAPTNADHVDDARSGIGGTGAFRPLALLRRGIALEHLGQTNQAMSAYEDALIAVPVGNPLLTDAGLSICHLAALKILNLAHDDYSRLPEDWRKNPDLIIIKLSNDTSPFEDDLLERLRVLESALSAGSGETPPPLSALANWFHNWQRDLESRKRFEEAADSRAGETSPWPGAFWVNGDFRWLSLSQGISRTLQGEPRGRYFVAFPESQLSGMLKDALHHEEKTGDFAVRLELAGRTIEGASRAMTDWQDQSTSWQVRSTNLPITVTVALADRPEFFAAERRRQRPFMALLLAAAGTCVLGYFLARCAFYRQLRLNDMKSDFVSSVSHELRAPIASVRLMAEGLERGKISEPAKQHEYFKFIVQECRRLSSLIENVLDFSRIEEGRKRYELESTDLVALTQQTVKVMETYAAERDISIALRTNGPAAPVDLDGKAMQQALVNLIDNAIKHSPKGSNIAVDLDFNPSPASAQPSSVLISVEDHGEGIAASEQDKIFERFYRIGSELRRETQGVGIGLSIVKHIVEAHGGRVTVRSAPGQGSTFTIELPMRKDANE